MAGGGRGVRKSGGGSLSCGPRERDLRNNRAPERLTARIEEASPKTPQILKDEGYRKKRIYIRGRSSRKNKN